MAVPCSGEHEKIEEVRRVNEDPWWHIYYRCTKCQATWEEWERM